MEARQKVKAVQCGLTCKTSRERNQSQNKSQRQVFIGMMTIFKAIFAICFCDIFTDLSLYQTAYA